MTQDDLDCIEYGLKAMLLFQKADGKTLAKGHKEADEWFNGGKTMDELYYKIDKPKNCGKEDYKLFLADLNLALTDLITQIHLHTLSRIEVVPDIKERKFIVKVRGLR